MSFSDEDLKRLKEYISVRKECSRGVPVHPTIASFFEEVEALLARLGAAEAMESFWKFYSPMSAEDEAEYDAKYETWRKAAGK